ncbi:MAG TPA: TonB-dependent receptor [Terriglobales bacterium]|nr:TonB-dependent receptor [Terriglobales bacterium]
MRKTLFRIGCALLGSLLLISPAALAQQVNVAQVAGQVTDSSGAVIAGATVRMIETQRGVVHTVVTDNDGRYVLPGLPVGAYKLEVQKQSFNTYAQQGIVLQVNDHVTLNAMLQAGAVSQIVEVNAGAAMVQTETTSVSNVVDSQRMVDLPLNGRFATQLIYTMPATVSGATLTNDSSGSKSFFSSVTVAVAGGQTNGTNYLLDGGDHNDTFGNVNLPFPFPDALQEFSVETSSLPARNGLHPGGVVNAVTKSGTNSFHGTLFDFDRDGIFNAKPRGFSPTGSQQDGLRRNQFGGTIGGPIVHDKLFFFSGYQGTRLKSQANNLRVKTITQAALNGDFTTLVGPGCTGTTTGKTLKAPFSGNQVNPASYDKAALALFSGNYIPISSDPCGFITYSLPTINNEDQIIGRVDYNHSSKQTLFGRYLFDQYTSPPPFSATNLIYTQTPGNWERAQSFVLGDNYTFTPTFINSAHVTLSRRRDNRGVDPRDINPTTLGVNMSPAIPNFLLFSITGYFGVGCGTCAPGHFNVNTWQGADDIDWIRGKHHFAFGADYIHTQNNTLTGYNENGTSSFSGSVSGDGLADFLLGNYSGWDQSRAQQVAYRQTMFSLYGQDTVRLLPRLTLIAGVRWEPSLQPYDYFHRGSLFNLADFQNNVHSSVYPTAPAGMLFYGDKGVPAGFTNTHWGNFGPRVGLTWDPTGSGKQVVRAGYGLLYDSTMTWYSQRLTSNPPVVNEINITTAGCGTFSNPWQNYSIANGCVANSNTNQNPFPGGFTFFPGGAQWVSLLDSMRPMYMQQWNFSYEKQFASNWMAGLSYLGSRSLHLPLSYDFNWAQNQPSVCAKFTGGCSVSNEPQRRYLTQIATSPTQGASLYGQFYLADDTGSSNYNGLIASIRHRFARNFTWLANYTYSHCLSTGDFNGDLRGTYYSQQNNPRADYGACNFDVRHIFNTSAVASSPAIGSGALRWLVEGWQVSPSIRATSGLPANVTLGADNSFTGEGTGIDRPNLNPGVPLYLNSWTVLKGGTYAYQVFNPAAFSKPAAGAYGNVPRDFLRNPGAWTVDLSLTRSFPIRERLKVEGRLDMFNAFNHWNPVAPSANWGSSSFGQVTSAPSPSFVPQAATWNDPRVLQLAAKVIF